MNTISDIAKRAGVSISTVSRVMNHPRNVSKETRERVLKIVKELEYLPRPWAKYLAISRTKFVAGFVIADRIRKSLTHKSNFYHHVYSGIKRVARQSEVDVRIQRLEEDKIDDTDGYLLIGADFDKKQVEKYRSTGKPVVLVDHYIPGMNIDAVVSDGYGGAFMAVTILIEEGFEKIVHIHNPLDAYSFKERLDGYIAAMKEHHLLPRAYEFNDISDNMSSVADLMLRSYGMPDAVFASNDFAIVRAVQEFRKRGIDVPEDVSVIGFDDSEETEEMDIASVRVFKDEMGAFAMRRLITLMMGQDLHPAKISLFTQPIIRGSIKNSRR
ncbi:MAG: LacI family DNA-binding transcriptional regulator [Thermotogae bacterium]|nr:LacI family DNA-binding transcriptional regulator [Thermotogota bacterium]